MKSGIEEITSAMLAEESKKINFEDGISCLPKVTVTLILFISLVFCLELYYGPIDKANYFIRYGAISFESIMAGECWRFISSAFIHWSVVHIISNCIVLYIAGLALEHAYTSKVVITGYMFSVVCSALLAIMDKNALVAGASGGVFGMLVMMSLFYYKYRRYFDSSDLNTGIFLIIWIIYMIVTGLSDHSISHLGHIGGALGGAIFFWCMPVPKRIANIGNIDEL